MDPFSLLESWLIREAGFCILTSRKETQDQPSAESHINVPPIAILIFCSRFLQQDGRPVGRQIKKQGNRSKLDEFTTKKDIHLDNAV